MREIKFRVWDKENKIMVDNIDKAYELTDNIFDGAYEEKEIYPFYDILFPFYVDMLTEKGSAYEDNFKLMQFTGLHDKNGKEIYEGDIVQILGGEYEQGFYEWDEKIQIKDLIYDGFNLIMTISQIGNQAIEVIGNIYENSELLKGADNIE